MPADKPLTEFDAVDAVFWALTFLLAAIHIYSAILEPAVANGRGRQFLLIGAAFLSGFAVRLTRFWRPILYLLGVGFAISLGVLWALGGVERPAIGLATGVVSVAFILVGIYQFVRGETEAATRSRRPGFE